jgi:hypothetical protein
MASSFSTLGIELIATGEASGLWGDKTNVNLQMFQEITSGYVAKSIAGGAQTTALSITNATVGSDARQAVIELTGTITGNQIVTVPDSLEKVYIVKNATSGSHTVQFKTASGTGVTFAATEKTSKLVFADGTNIVDTGFALGVAADDISTGDAAVTIATSSGDITVDSPADIVLDADGADIFLKDAGTTYGSLTNSSGNLIIKSGTTTAATFSGANVTLAGTVGSGAITSTGTVQGTTITATTAFVPDASDGAALGTSSLEFSDLFLADAAVINLGDDQDVTITHVADTGILLNAASVIQFRDSGLTIGSNADGDLDIVSDGTAVDSINVESAGGITLDAGTAGSGIIYEDDGTEMMRIHNSSSDVIIESKVSDKDIIIKGNDGGSTVSALTLDMSAAGAASFNAGVTANAGIETKNGATSAGFIKFFEDSDNGSNALTLQGPASAADFTLILPSADGSNGDVLKTDGSGNLSFGAAGTAGAVAADDITAGDSAVSISTSSGNITIDAAANDTDIIFKGTDNTADITMLTLDGSEAGAASFNGVVTANAGVVVDNITIDGTEIDLSSGDLTVDVAGDIDLDAGGGNVKVSVAGTQILDIANSSSDVIIKPVVDAKDLIFQQRDGTEVARVEDNGTFNVVSDKLAINGTAITSTAAELNIMDGVTATATEINIIDGDTSATSTTLVDADRVVANDAGTMKQVALSDVKTYINAPSKGLSIVFSLVFC